MLGGLVPVTLAPSIECESLPRAWHVNKNRNRRLSAEVRLDRISAFVARLKAS